MNNTPTPNKDEVNLDNLPLKEALRFVYENSTTGGLFTKAALNTLAAGCRELAAVTEQRDRLAEALQKLADCDWVITLPDRMDAVRNIARQALQSLNPDHTVAANDMIAAVKGGDHES